MSNISHYRVQNDIQSAVAKGTKDAPLDNYVKNLEDKMKVKIISLNEEDIVFDLVGVDSSIANALRRILLAEVPTVAIENVWISVNTSIIQDEVLAHRVGLIPIKADPALLNFPQGEEETDSNTLVFHLDVVCGAPPAGTNPAEYVETVYSKHLTWLAQGNQEERFVDGVSTVHDDIVIAKLKPGQRIEFEAHCHKGVGKDHTKYSPVATATYRLLPDIQFPEPITGKKAQELKDMCPMQVFDIEDIGGAMTAVAARPRDCTMCRECIRKDGWQEKVHLLRKANHYIFTVESTGVLPPEKIVKEAFSVLKNKANRFREIVENYQSTI